MAAEQRLRIRSIKYAKSRGVGHIRMSFRPGVASGWPDDLFLIPGGRPLLVEFKAPGKQPTALQEHRISELRGLGYDVRVCDGFSAFSQALTRSLATAPVYDSGSGPLGAAWGCGSAAAAGRASQ